MKKENIAIFLLSLPSFLVLVALAFEWTIIDWLTEFVYDPLVFGLFLTTGISVALSIVLLFKRHRFRQAKYYFPLVACLCVLTAVTFVPFTDLWLHANFSYYRKDREQIAARIFSGELSPNVKYNESLIALPSGFGELSKGGGEVMLYNFGGDRGVYFFTYRGILGISTGYLYMNSDRVPSGADLVQISQVAPRWFLIRTE